MLKPLYRFRTNCCGNENAWQYSLRSRTFLCAFCGSVAEFASLPCEILPPVADARTPVAPGMCPARVAFISSDQERGFLNFTVGDQLHCGIIDTTGCIKSYYPNEKQFRCERSPLWKQSIICEFPDIGEVGGLWSRIIEEEIQEEPKNSEFDCLDFAVNVLNRAAGKQEYTREKLSETMCHHLYHVMRFAEIQRRVTPS